MAQQLAQALRASRLTVVVGAAGAGKSTVLAGVLPLLRRRAIDVALSAASATPGVVVPFPDRRSRGADQAQRELIHSMDRWDDAALQALQRALDDDGPVRGRRPVADAMTPGNLADHIERHGGARLLFVFDHFEELLQAGRSRVGLRRLVDTWAAAVRSPQLRANFLVTVDERSWPWLHAVCVGLPSTHWSALCLHAPSGQRTLEPMARPQQVAPTLAARRLPGIAPRHGKEPTDADFLRSVNNRVRRVAQSARDQHARNDDFAASVPPLTQRLAPRVAAVAPLSPPPAMLDVPIEAHDDAPIDPPTVEPAPAMPRQRRRPSPMRLGLAVLLTCAGVGAWLWHSNTDTPVATANAPAVAVVPPAAPAPQPAAPTEAATATTAPASYDVIGVSANGEHARIARELVAALPGDGAPPRIEPLAGQADPVAWLQQAPGRLGIAHWDALNAAPHGGPAVPLRVLTPLFAEPMLFVVRADSPLRTIRQLQGRRISVGPAHSDAAHSVRELLRRLLGSPPADTVALAPDEAVAELVAFGAIDAIAVVDAQPMAWWNALDPAVARRLRVLTLNPTHPRDQRLLDSLGTEPLQVSLRGAVGGVALVPAVMSYLVASGEADAAADERLAAMAQALCRELPQLQQQGHAAWRGLRPRAQLDTGWPVAQSFRSTVSRCVRGG